MSDTNSGKTQDMSDKPKYVRQKKSDRARFVIKKLQKIARQSYIYQTNMTIKRKICPTELDISDKNGNTTQDLCATDLDVSDTNENKTQDMSGRTRCV